jgi:hypothetical protein
MLTVEEATMDMDTGIRTVTICARRRPSRSARARRPAQWTASRRTEYEVYPPMSAEGVGHGTYLNAILC